MEAVGLASGLSDRIRAERETDWMHERTWDSATIVPEIFIAQFAIGLTRVIASAFESDSFHRSLAK